MDLTKTLIASFNRIDQNYDTLIPRGYNDKCVMDLLVLSYQIIHREGKSMMVCQGEVSQVTLRP